ncbi:TniQ family protein [Thiomicrorhabdus sp.]|uniref:TniQ family protein n=1 Tax=Thiomicrorhabdus sp. TaxID=2039724 RepID=UPI0029C910B6|nr:TniQ family protein [Thiomicrorhabdus sp.]
MFTGKLWPVHPHPYQDELLSSWLVRIAHANGEKVQSFCHHEFGQKHQIWNRDIDRLSPDWLLNKLSEKTATPIERVRQTTLKRYEGVLFDHTALSGVEKWITPLRIYHRTRKSHGLQFCPECLKEDAEPYFRTQWRVAFHTFCPKHNVMMHDRCPCCGEPVVFQRIELGKGNEETACDKPLSTCFNCGFDLADSKPEEAVFWSNDISASWGQLLSGIQENKLTKYQSEQLIVLHQFVKLLSSGVTSEKLLCFIESNHNETLKRPTLHLRHFEANDMKTRFQIAQCAWWLLSDWPQNLYHSWLKGSIRYNCLLKDLEKSPDWYIESVENLRLNYKVRQKLYHSLNK